MMRQYRGNLCPSTSTAISIGEMPRDTFAMIDKIAERFNVGRCHVARCILEATDSDAALASVSARIAEPKVQKRRLRYGRAKAQKPAVTERGQDRVCREINGSLPAGGCRYPNCGCSA